MACASHHHARVANRFLLREPSCQPCPKKANGRDDQRHERRTTISAVVTVLAVLLIGALVKSEGASRSDCSLGGLGDDFPKKRACGPATLRPARFRFRPNYYGIPIGAPWRIPLATSGEKASARTPVSLECTIRGLLSWTQGAAMRAISCMTCAIVLCVASSLSGAASAESVDKPAVNDKPIVKKGLKGRARQNLTRTSIGF